MKILFVSYRFGYTDGVSVEAAKWKRVLEDLGHEVHYLAGESPASESCQVMEQLALTSRTPPPIHALKEIFDRYDLIVAENICSLPLNEAVSEAVANALSGRRAVLHHHDLPWQRPGRFEGFQVPDDENFIHVTINNYSEQELRSRGFREVRTIYNCFEEEEPTLPRHWIRSVLKVGKDQPVFLHPSRALPRKRIDLAMEIALQARALYWLTARAEDGFSKELNRLKARFKKAGLKIVHGPGPYACGFHIANAYLACDAVLLPSSWEGFGNASLEGSLYKRPVLVGDYPASRELRSIGFVWFRPEETGEFLAFVTQPDQAVLDSNYRLAKEHFSLDRLKSDLRKLTSDILG